MQYKLSYLRSMWNVIDLTTLILTLVIIIMDFADTKATTLRTVSSVAIVLLWMKFFYFLRIFDSTAPLIRMIVEITADIRPFLLVLVVAIFGFANGFFLLALNRSSEVPEGEESYRFLTTYIEALRYVYLLGLGEFGVDEFAGKDETVLWIFFIIASIFILIVLLNLLIAIMSDTFAKVAATSDQAMMREHLQLIMENKQLPSLRRLKEVKYLISISRQAEFTKEQQML